MDYPQSSKLSHYRFLNFGRKYHPFLSITANNEISAGVTPWMRLGSGHIIGCD